jgi:hypothetical protein
VRCLIASFRRLVPATSTCSGRPAVRMEMKNGILA